VSFPELVGFFPFFGGLTRWLSHPPKVALLVELLPLPASPTIGSGLAYQPLLVATTHLACGEELEEQRLAQADWAGKSTCLVWITTRIIACLEYGTPYKALFVTVTVWGGR